MKTISPTKITKEIGTYKKSLSNLLNYSKNYREIQSYMTGLWKCTTQKIAAKRRTYIVSISDSRYILNWSEHTRQMRDDTLQMMLACAICTNTECVHGNCSATSIRTLNVTRLKIAFWSLSWLSRAVSLLQLCLVRLLLLFILNILHDIVVLWSVHGNSSSFSFRYSHILCNWLKMTCWSFHSWSACTMRNICSVYSKKSIHFVHEVS